MTIDRQFLDAAHKGETDLCLSLLDKGANLHAQDRGDLYATDLAAWSGHMATISALIERGAALDGPMFKKTLGKAAYMGHAAVVEKLVGLGIPLDILGDEFLWTPLHQAALSGRVEISQWLLERGAELGARTHDGQTPLHKAVRSDNFQICRLFLEHGADVGARDHRSNAPMNVAAEHARGKVQLLLLAYGADQDDAPGMNKCYTPAQCCAMLGLTGRMLEIMDQGLLRPSDDVKRLSELATEKGHSETAAAVHAQQARLVMSRIRTQARSFDGP